MLVRRFLLLPSLCGVTLLAGCATSGPPSIPDNAFRENVAVSDTETLVLPAEEWEVDLIQPVNFQDDGSASLPEPPAPAPTSSTSLSALEEMALRQNPRLQRLSQEYQAALARSLYADKLPDPRFGANVFGNAIETAAGSQRANMTFSQAIPWLSRLSAEEQRQIFEAYAVAAEWEAERLAVLASIRTGWYRLYVLDRQIEVVQANQELLQSLIDVANARIATGGASQGDVLLGTVELSQLEERLMTYRRQRLGVEAEINRLVARPADVPIGAPKQLPVRAPVPGDDEIYQLALQDQPEIEAARMRTQATRWGVEVARLMRRPEFALSASYFPTDDNRPASSVVDVGQDPWSLGAQMSIPLWHRKYDAMANEARWRHQAAHSSVEEISNRYESAIVDLSAEARRARETAALYQNTILPQARQTLSADQEAYANGTVEFDRVIRDYRNLLTLEVGYHQALGELNVAIARLRQAAGTDFSVEDVELKN